MQNRIQLAVLLSMLINFTLVFGQKGQHSLDIIGGVNMANQYISSNMSHGFRFAPKFGLAYSYRATDRLSIEANVLYNDIGAQGKLTLTDALANKIGEANYYIKHSFLSIPFKLGYYFGSSTFGFTRIGFQASYLLRGQFWSPGHPSSTDDTYFIYDQKPYFKSWDFAGVFEVGGGHKLTENLSVISSLGFQFSLVPLNRNLNNANDIYLYAISFVAGLRYNF